MENYEKIILNSAAEESSLFEVMMELRDSISKQKTFDEFIASMFEAKKIIEKYYLENAIKIVRNGEICTVDDGFLDIYNTFLSLKY